MMKLTLKSLFIFLVVLYIGGSLFGLLMNNNTIDYFYVVTIVTVTISIYGFLKKNILIYLLALPGILRIFLYLKDEKLSFIVLATHILLTIVPMVVAYCIHKNDLKIKRISA